MRKCRNLLLALIAVASCGDAGDSSVIRVHVLFDENGPATSVTYEIRDGQRLVGRGDMAAGTFFLFPGPPAPWELRTVLSSGSYDLALVALAARYMCTGMADLSIPVGGVEVGIALDCRETDRSPRPELDTAFTIIGELAERP